MHEKVSGMACPPTLRQRRHVANPPLLQRKMVTCSPEVLEACSFSSERKGTQDLEGQGYCLQTGLLTLEHGVSPE